MCAASVKLILICGTKSTKTVEHKMAHGRSDSTIPSRDANIVLDELSNNSKDNTNLIL